MFLKIKLTFASIIFVAVAALAQSPLTVEKIMRDPKWMGTFPSNISWDDASKAIYFNWNPDNNPADSLYQYSLASSQITKVAREDKVMLSLGAGVYNQDF